MSFFSKLFGSANTASVVESLASAGDRLFTSDEERLKWQAMMLKIKTEPATLREFASVLLASSANPFVAGGKSAVMYCLSAVAVYHLIVRDVLIIVLNRPEMSGSGVSSESLLNMIGVMLGV